MTSPTEAFDSGSIVGPGDTILLPLMGYPSERDAAFIALVVAEYFGSNLAVFHIYSGSEKTENVFHDHMNWIQEEAKKMGVPLDIVVKNNSLKQPVHKCILSHIEELCPKLTVMMRRKKGLFHQLFGSIAERVARKSPYSVMIVRSPIKDWVARPHLNPMDIVVPIGSSTPSEIAAAQIAIAIANAGSSRDATITLLHVIVVPETVPIIPEEDEMLIQEEKEFIKKAGEYGVMMLFPMDTRVIVGRDIGRSVRQYVNNEQADLIVMGVPYLPRKIFGLYGTDTSEIFNNSNCPVVMLFDKGLGFHLIKE